MSSNEKNAVYTSSSANDSDHAPGHYFAIASVNVGLGTDAFTGQSQQYHLGRTDKLIEQAMSKPTVLGIAFCEVGDSLKSLHGTEQQLFDNAVRCGSSKAGYKTDPCRRPNLRPRHDREYHKQRSASQHAMGRHHRRVVNSHQPSSKLNPYPLKCRHDVCTGIFRRATCFSLCAPQGAAEHKSQTTTPVSVVFTGDLNVDKNQIANYGKECGLDGKLETCAVNRRKAHNGEKPMDVPNSEDDNNKLQKHCDLA